MRVIQQQPPKSLVNAIKRMTMTVLRKSKRHGATCPMKRSQRMRGVDLLRMRGVGLIHRGVRPLLQRLQARQNDDVVYGRCRRVDPGLH